MPNSRLLSTAGLLAALVAGALVLASGVTGSLDRLLLDAAGKLNRRYSPTPVTDNIVIVGINDAFLDGVPEPIALSHFYLADFLRAASQAQAKAIGIDLVLPEKRLDALTSATHPDMDFHRALLAGLIQASQKTQLVVARQWDHQRGHFRDIQLDYAAVLAAQGSDIQALASAEFSPDSDGFIRRYPAEDVQPDHDTATFAAEMAAAMGRRQHWQGLIDYQRGAAFSYVPLQQVLQLARDGDTTRLQQLFGGKAVLLGTVFDDADLLSLPVPLAEWHAETLRQPGVLAHAQMLRNMLNGGFIQPAPAALPWMLSALFALFWLGDKVRIKLPALLLAALLLLLASNLLLLRGVWLAPASMLLTGVLALASRTAVDGWRHYRDKQLLSRSFSGYVSPAVMQEILAGGLDPAAQGKKLPVCVLFADVRGFTTLSEQLAAEEVVQLLNRYFARMTAVIHAHQGTVDKFIGDGLMAFFGAPNRLADAQQHAFSAARAMLAALAELNLELLAEQRPALQIGIGLHCGDAVIGHIGSPERHEYTAIGDVVNAASRIEGLCRELGYPILCSSAVAGSLSSPGTLVELGPQPLKGRSAITLYGYMPESRKTA